MSSCAKIKTNRILFTKKQKRKEITAKEDSKK